MLKIINGGGVNQVVREAAVWCRVLIEPIGRLRPRNPGKQRAMPGAQEEGDEEDDACEEKKKPAPKPAPAPVAPSPPICTEKPRPH